ncbi:FAD-binding protein [Streptomyces sp. NPDC127084]|uniref:FAD-binding protein n=1 Tax=Streptomyces sp. NPDC127084 TaxID=3347133 RepID=UPI00364A3C58
MSANSWANWAGNVMFGARETAYPRSLAELMEIVARSGPREVKAFGCGHSFSRVGDTIGVLVSLREMPWVCEAVRGGEGALTGLSVGGGLTFGEICLIMDGFGGALPALASLPNILVAGACATGTHGSGWGTRTVSAGVREVAIVAGDGSLCRITREDQPFPGTVVSLGALGGGSGTGSGCSGQLRHGAVRVRGAALFQPSGAPRGSARGGLIGQPSSRSRSKRVDVKGVIDGDCPDAPSPRRNDFARHRPRNLSTG